MDAVTASYASRATDYRNKAEELRAIAATMKNAASRETFLTMAIDYIHMAEVLERLSGNLTTQPDADSAGKPSSDD